MSDLFFSQISKLEPKTLFLPPLCPAPPNNPAIFFFEKLELQKSALSVYKTFVVIC